jgi:hypothetical protein
MPSFSSSSSSLAALLFPVWALPATGTGDLSDWSWISRILWAGFIQQPIWVCKGKS